MPRYWRYLFLLPLTLALPLALAVAFGACTPQPAPAVNPAPSEPPEDAAQLSVSGKNALQPPVPEEYCAPCDLPDIQPLPEGYSLEDDIAAIQAEEAAAEQAAQQDGAGEYRVLSAQQAKQRMDEEEGILIVDVRTRAEYEAGHIPGAILIPNETIGAQPPERLPDPSAVILLYCRSGNRSRQAAYKLLDLGYTQVFDFGGINAWPYKTVTGPEA